MNVDLELSDHDVERISDRIVLKLFPMLAAAQAGREEEVDGMLDVDDVAAQFNIAVSTIRNWVTDKKIPYVKVGGLVRFRQEDIDAYVEEHKHAAHWQTPAEPETREAG